jgi:hypothetical protein
MRPAIKACVLGVVIGAGMLVSGGPAAADDVPYTDPAQVGYIGFCDSGGHSIDHGSLDDVPFVAKAVGSAAAQPPYDGAGRVAFLDAYQPREGVTPAEWSGEELIAVSTYTNPAHPMVVGTEGEISLRQFVEDFPPAWDGLVQLRLYLKVPDVQYDPLHYSATDIEVNGDSWHVVRGGDVACDAGRARSLAAVLAPGAASGGLNSADNSPSTAEHPGSPTTAGNSDSTAGRGSTEAHESSSAASEGAGAASGDSDSSDGGTSAVGYVVLAVLVAVVFGGLLLSRWRRSRMNSA